MRVLLHVLTAALFFGAAPAMGQTVDFGDDTSTYARDGECDDKRFEGPGMTTTPLLDSDIGHDATDCREAWEAGRLSLAADGGDDDPLPEAEPVEGIEFGTDDSIYANDGECDDPRFGGAGMASPPLSDEHTGRDATDCRAAWDAGEIQLAGDDADDVAQADPVIFDGIEFGDDSSSYADDGECDDPRFDGPGMASSPLDEDIGRDATDCLTAWQAGDISLAADRIDQRRGGSRL